MQYIPEIKSCEQKNLTWLPPPPFLVKFMSRPLMILHWNLVWPSPHNFQIQSVQTQCCTRHGHNIPTAVFFNRIHLSICLWIELPTSHRNKNSEVDFFFFSHLGLTVTKINFEIIFLCGNHPKNPQCKWHDKKNFEKTKFWVFTIKRNRLVQIVNKTNEAATYVCPIMEIVVSIWK